MGHVLDINVLFPKVWLCAYMSADGRLPTYRQVLVEGKGDLIGNRDL